MSTITLPTDVLFTATDCGAVLLDGRQSRYWQLNEVATIVVRAVLDGGDAPAAAATVCQRYDVAVDVALADVVNLLDELRGVGLIHQTRSRQ